MDKINKISMEDFYKLKLHEHISLTGSIAIMRVPGGWIYYWEGTSCFVPYSGEFDERFGP